MVTMLGYDQYSVLIKWVTSVLLQMTQTEVFVDTKNMPVMKKLVKPLDQQGQFESRRCALCAHTWHTQLQEIYNII